MSSAEDQEILARIGQLAGQINRHKNQKAGLASAPTRLYHPYQSMSPHRNASEQRFDASEAQNTTSPAWSRVRGQPSQQQFRLGKPQSHRHKSLVLNGNGSTTDLESGGTSDASTTSSWVTKKDRHLQLINPAVYDKELQARSKSMSDSQRQKDRLTDERERSKLLNHLDRTAGGAAGGGMVRNTNSRPAGASTQYEVVVDGIRFQVAKNGSKLVKVLDNNAPKATPKTATVGGVKFYRSRNGNLYRHGAVKAQRRSGAVSKVNAPCRVFSMTGSCTNGPRCRYIHDPSKVAICKDMLLKGDCVNGDACDLSHELTPERTPACLHFAKGKCTNPNCRYTHVQVTPGSLVCRAFGIYGYCDKGANCDDRHVFECPDFGNTGVCKTKGCKLPHRERASVLRKASSAVNTRGGAGDVEMEDVSSDEDGESVDSNDVDSDAVDEFLGEDDYPDDAFSAQQEFIQLS